MSDPQWPLLYVAFNRRVIALNRATGETVWDWKAHSGHGFPAILVDVPDVYVSVQGYTYCLDAETGQQKWFNKLAGMGTGVPMLAIHGGSSGGSQAAVVAHQQAAASAAAAT